MRLVQPLNHLHLFVTCKLDDLHPLSDAVLRQSLYDLINEQTTERVRSFLETRCMQCVINLLGAHCERAWTCGELRPLFTEWDQDWQCQTILVTLLSVILGYFEMHLDVFAEHLERAT